MTIKYFLKTSSSILSFLKSRHLLFIGIYNSPLIFSIEYSFGFSSNNTCKIPVIKALFSILLLNPIILFEKLLKKNNK